MPLFQYRAYGENGRLAEGQVESHSTAAAKAALWTTGLIAFQLAEVSSSKVPWWRKELFTASKVDRSAFATFTREFSELYGSGVSLDSCLRMLADQSSSAGLKQKVFELYDDVLAGRTLADSMDKHRGVFPPDYISVVRAGEISGTLAVALEELAELLERRLQIDGQIKSALTYPIILVVAAIMSMIVVIGVLVPSIAPIFAENGNAMPLALASLVFLRDNAILFLVGCVGIAICVFVTAGYINRSPERREIYDAYKLRIPILKNIIIHSDIARFTRTLGTLLRAGVPLIVATKSSVVLVRNTSISAHINRAIELVREGTPLSTALRDSKMFPTAVLSMIATGEETAKLGQMLLRAAQILENRNRRAIEAFLSILTPALTMLIAALVGGLLFTVMSAVLSINDLATG